MKKATSGTGSVRQRPDGRWEARYSAGIDPATGKYKQRSVYGKTQAEVLQKMNAALRDLEEHDFDKPQAVTLSAWMQTWFDTYTVQLRDTTRRQYLDNIKNHILPNLGAVKLEKLTPMMVQEFFNKLSSPKYRTGSKGQEKNGLSPKSVRNIYRILHQALQQAVKPPLRLMKYNPCEDIILPAAEHKEMQVLTPEEAQKLLQAAQCSIYYPAIYIALFCGIRRGEVCGIKMENLNFNDRTILICDQLQADRMGDGGLRDVTLKNRKPRKIYPCDAVWDMLAQYLPIRHAILDQNGITECRYLLVSSKGTPLDPDNLGRAFRESLARAGIDRPIRLHDLRHTYSLIQLSAGTDIKTLQESLGHHDPGFTLRQYGHTSESNFRRSADAMQRYADALFPEED